VSYKLLADVIEGLIVKGDYKGVVNVLKDIAIQALRDMNAALATGLDALATGLAMLGDDIHDFGLFDRLHHWIIGLIVLIAGIAILILVILKAIGLI